MSAPAAPASAAATLPELPPATATPPTASASAPVTPAEPAPTAPTRDWPWWLPTALLLAALALAAVLFLWRRRGKAEAETAGPAHAAAAPDAPPRAPNPPPPSPQEPPDSPALALRLEPLELRLTEGEVRLAYRLLVTNRGKLAAGPLDLAGDMICAHGALPARHQLLPDSSELPTRHVLPALPPGETATLAGELPLPMRQVLPIAIGATLRLFPLVRWLALDDLGPAGTPRVFAIGRPGAGAGAPLTAFRLDHGPARHASVAAREIEIARWLSLDGVGRGG